jgi:hypothetical protein
MWLDCTVENKREYWWTYFLIPWIAGFIGYFTNVLALQMTFYPIEFWGWELFRIKEQPWGLFGWQGIIPSKAEKMASISFELFTTKLFHLREIFMRLDPVRFSQVMSDSILLMMDTIVEEVAMQYMPRVWTNLPKEVRDDIIVATEAEADSFMAEFMADLLDHVEDVIDIKDMTVSTCVANKNLIVQIFQECGEKEFIFIRRSGFYFGFLFGLLQLLVWYFIPWGWIMPTAGFLVGWVTNWLALKVIFRPLRPHKFLCWTVQGIFLKRQAEVSETFARIVMTEILHVKAMWDCIFTGPLSANFFAMLRAHTLVFTDKLIADLQPIAIASLGAENFARMKEDIAQKVIDKLPTIIDNCYQYTQEALDMENSVREKMKELSPEDFEGVL